MLTRSEWGARAPKSITPVSDKTGGIVIHHTAARSPTSHWPDCWNRWRGHQNFHMDRQGWSDIAYNHLVCAHGFWFEGRGWDSRNGANLPVNASTLSICWEGTTGDPVDPAAIKTINQIITEAVTRGWAPRVRGHQEVRPEPTACPGSLQPLIVNGTLGPKAAGTPVMGAPEVSLEQALAFVLARATNAAYPIDVVREIVTTTWAVGLEDGVRPDLALMLERKETGDFGFGGVAQPEQFNFGGIGTTGPGEPGVTFSTVEAGVRAVVRRMRMYAVDDPAFYDETILGRSLPRVNTPTNPRGFKGWGKHPNIEDFGGAWAVPGDGYGESIVAMVELMKQTPVPSEPPVPFTVAQTAWLDNRYVRRNT